MKKILLALFLVSSALLVKEYYPNGKIKIDEPYKNGQIDGIAKAYDEAGKVIQQATFKNGQQVK